MKGRWAVSGALMALLVLVLAGWTTNKSSGTKHSFHLITTTGAVCGVGTVLGDKPTFISIAEVVADGGTTSLFYIESEDLVTSPDTIVLGNGVPFEGNFPHGIDSLNCITLDGSANFSVEVSN